jgi:hypothetical protein
MNPRHSYLPPTLAACTHNAPVDDDELPPWLGERMRDVTHHIHHGAREASIDSEDSNHDD